MTDPKYVYVLTTDFTNSLEQQCELSQYSLLLHNEKAKIITLVDDITFSKMPEDCCLKKFGEVVKISCPAEYSLKQRSRYLKFTMREAVEGDFLYIDSDTVVCENLDEIFKTECSVAQVLDLHIPFSENAFLYNSTLKKIQKSKLNYLPSVYYNGGVFLSKDDQKSHDFFKLALEAWKKYQTKDFCIDQVAFNYANFSMGNFIKEIDGKWNCQVADNGLKYLNNAKIIHYFATTAKKVCLFSDDELMKQIKENGFTENIKQMVLNAKSQFNHNAIILSDNEKIDIYRSNMFALAYTLYKKHRILYNFSNLMLSFFYAFAGKIKSLKKN